MKLLALFLLAIFALPSIVIAYPKEQLNECILSAKTNPNVTGISEESIEDFCDCSLKEIIDKGRNAKSSANQCVKKFFR